MYVQSPCPNYLVGYELRTDLPRRVGILDSGDETFRTFRVKFRSRAAGIFSHDGAMSARALQTYPSKKKKRKKKEHRNSRQNVTRKVSTISRGAFNPPSSFAFLSRAPLRFLMRLETSRLTPRDSIPHKNVKFLPNFAYSRS